MGKRSVTIASLLACLALSAYAADLLVVRERELGVMGTSLRICALGEAPRTLDTAIDAAVSEMRRVEDLMTDWRHSPLVELNEAAGTGAQPAPRELAAIVSRSLAMAELTGGAFDPTFASVGKLWDFRANPPRIPDNATITNALAAVGVERVSVNPETCRITLSPGTRIGLGGIAKGYGVDRAMAILRQHGVEHAMVNAGGDLKVLGRKQGELWEIAIKHPRNRARAMALIRLSNSCVVTSGDYERFFQHEGKRYHHILDPRTGHPATGAMSATVVAQSAEYADALATALCVLGPEKGLAMVKKLPRVEALIVDMDGKVHTSPGLADAVLPDHR